MHHKERIKVTGTVIEKKQQSNHDATVTLSMVKPKNYCWWNNQSKGI
jgi:hypothetical protein